MTGPVSIYFISLWNRNMAERRWDRLEFGQIGASRFTDTGQRACGQIRIAVHFVKRAPPPP